jgi:hypothetical protein
VPTPAKRSDSLGLARFFLVCAIVIGVGSAVTGTWWTVVAMVFVAAGQLVTLRRAGKGQRGRKR